MCGVVKAVGGIGQELEGATPRLGDLNVIVANRKYGRASMISWLCYWPSRPRARSWIFSC